MNYLSQVVKAVQRGDSIPTEPRWNKWIHRNLSKNHCPECLKLHDCWFAKENTPQWPHHEYCHCILEDIPYVNVMYNCTSDVAYNKFNPYLFDPDNFYKHGKSAMLESWGYTVADSNWLQNEIQKQGLEKYINGDYILNKLDRNGQRINIRVEISRKNKTDRVSFITGWMIEPDGHIRLVTPYGDN